MRGNVPRGLAPWLWPQIALEGMLMRGTSCNVTHMQEVLQMHAYYNILHLSEVTQLFFYIQLERPFKGFDAVFTVFVLFN